MVDETQEQEAPTGAPLVSIEEGDIDDLEVVRKALLEGTIELELDPDRMVKAIVERILEAPAASVFAPDSVIHARDILYRTFKVFGVRWFPSAFEEGPSVYAVCDSVLIDTGERAIVTVGSTRGLAQLYRAVHDGLLPLTLRVVEASRPTSRGFVPYWLEAVPEAETPEA